MRLLMSPDAAEGGTVETKDVEVKPIVATKPAVVVPKIDADGSKIEVDRAELDDLRSFVTEAKRKAEIAETEAKRKTEEDRKAAGKWQELLDEKSGEINRLATEGADVRSKLTAERDSAIKAAANFAIKSEIATAIAGVADRLSQGAAKFIAPKLREELSAKQSGDSWTVSAPEGKTVSQYLESFLGDPENALLLKASARGGPDVGGSKPAPTPSQETAGGPTLGHQMLNRAAQRGDATPAFLQKYRSN